MDTVEVSPAQGASLPARRVSSWVVALSPWVAVVLLGAALLWVLPRAADARAAAVRGATLTRQVSGARAAAGAAATALAATRSQLSDVTTRLDSLRHAVKRNGARIDGLNAQEKKLRAEKARLSAPSSAPIVTPPIGPPCHRYPNQYGGYDTICP